MGKKRILIADDDKRCVMLLHQLLEDAGYDVDDTSGGSEVLRRLTQGVYDLLLLDYDMRDIKGDKLSLMLRMDPLYEKLPIMIITGHVEKDEVVFKEYGATEVVYKPFENIDFLTRIRGLLGENA